ncbi:MAG: hypothetical protein K9J37_23610 [Saprospiraceae bacterium]|nr:hypothetical protein [Saprospiraceae bacterium]MCF8252914.1 hypothetical protein [Saprospiraceae bacterium]MCF8314460.1 hypothetical protein [Saprospiraceae bacterium]MCF8443341.1 hypothetical protein [Saprospiraceae bacterium]
MKIQIALFLLLLPLLSSAQDIANDANMRKILPLVTYRESLLVGNPARIRRLEDLLAKWNQYTISLDVKREYILNLLWYGEVLDHSFKKVKKKAMKHYPKSRLIYEMTEADYQTIVDNKDLLDLINGGILKTKYPFQIDNASYYCN